MKTLVKLAPLSVALTLVVDARERRSVWRAAAAVTDAVYVIVERVSNRKIRLRLRPKRRGTRRSLERLAARLEAAIAADLAATAPGEPSPPARRS